MFTLSAKTLSSSRFPTVLYWYQFRKCYQFCTFFSKSHPDLPEYSLAYFLFGQHVRHPNWQNVFLSLTLLNLSLSHFASIIFPIPLFIFQFVSLSPCYFFSSSLSPSLSLALCHTHSLLQFCFVFWSSCRNLISVRPEYGCQDNLRGWWNSVSNPMRVEMTIYFYLH